MNDPITLYLDLLKRCLTNCIYADTETRTLPVEAYVRPELQAAFRAQKLKVVQPLVIDWAVRMEGRDWPPTAHTMIGVKRLAHLQRCVEDVLRDHVPGDLIETGVWRGGATILMRGVLKAYAVTDRTVWVADSFAGLPQPDLVKYPQDAKMDLHTYPYLAVSLEQVQANFARYGLLDEQVRFVKGWFRDTLPILPAKRLAVARLDGDMYESTIDALVHLYPKLSLGGYMVVDDYGNIGECRQAVDDYRAGQGISEEIRPIDASGVYWRRLR
jgi:O-methyltransferase